MYLVEYKDDYNQKHICTANTMGDIRFLQNRFGEKNVSYTMAGKYQLYPVKSKVDLKF